MPQGVYVAFRKDKSEYYRVSITYHNKHISLGSFDDITMASIAYDEANEVLYNTKKHFVNTDTLATTYTDKKLHLSFEKFITLVNFRDNHIYIKTPIYLCKKYFLYFLSKETVLRFNTDDLFYYSTHKIMTRGNYYFVNDYGMQTSILTRYGIHSHSVKGRDYIFRNGDEHDFRYENVCIINKYNGVSQIVKNGRTMYRAIIHINGNFIIGDYTHEHHAAIAYNKAIDMLSDKVNIAYTQNYIENISSIEYASCYNSIKMSKKFRNYVQEL